MWLLLATLFTLCNSNSHCEWNVNVNNKTMTLNLQDLQKLNKPIECALDSNNIFTNRYAPTSDLFLAYTPCRNGVNCSIPDTNVHNSTMSQISNKTLPSCIAYLGIWNSGKTAPIYNLNTLTNKEEYIFEYKNGYKQTNGSCTNGRYLNVTYTCNANIQLINESNITCKQLPYNIHNNGICYYEILIPTKLACLSEKEDGKSNALSATIWLAIIFGVIFFFYCCIGYIMNGWRYHQWCDCIGNIPNANIWCCCCYKGRDYVTVYEHNTGLINDADKSVQWESDKFE